MTLREKRLASTLLLALLILVALAPAAAQDAELNPAFIEGNAGLGSLTLDRTDVNGFSGSFSASLVLGSSPSPVRYSLTVQVEAGSVRTWTVRTSVRTDNFADFLRFPDRVVSVPDGATVGGVDFVEPNPCFIEGTVTVTGGGTLSTVFIRAVRSGTDAWTSRHVDGFYRFPVLPGTDYRVDPTIQLVGISSSIRPPDVFVDCAAGDTVVVDFTVETPEISGSIFGAVQLSGHHAIDRYEVFASGPTFGFQSLGPPFDADGSASYAIDTLQDGTYFITAQARLNSFDDFFSFPIPAWDGSFPFGPNRPEIVGGAAVEVNAFAQQAFIDGTLVVRGSADLGDVSFASANASGAFDTPSWGGSSFDRINTATGAIDLVVSEGSWAVNRLSISFFRPQGDPDSFLSQSSSFFDLTLSTPLPVAAGGSASRDFDLPLGSVTVNLTVAGGGVLSNPQLDSGLCRELDPATGELLRTWSFFSRSSGQIDVPTGQVTFLAPRGTCTFRARAFVNGSLTTFGELEVEVTPGVDQTVDIGGPSLTLDLAPGQCFDLAVGGDLTVSGTASDDVAVDTVAVNGYPATTASTNNPSDPAEVSWTVDVPIFAKGPLELVTVATDTAGKTATDTRTVFIDSGPPALSFTPADGTVVSLPTTSVLVEGTTSDDAGVDSVTVDGAPVALYDQGGGVFGFSADVFLDTCGSYPCETTITVVSTDISEKSTTVSHRVTLIDNQPPIADAGGPYAVDEGGTVTVVGGGSDPDDDPLVFAWDLDNGGDYETPGQNATFSAASLDGPSSYTVGLLVTDDGGLSASDTATVNVANVAPTVSPISASVDPVAVDTSVAASATFGDPGVPDTHEAVWQWGDGSLCDTSVDAACAVDAANSAVSGSHTYGAAGVYTVELAVTDDDGGIGQSIFQYVVVYDPSAGFVTGGGWIDSPAGAYVADPTLAGRANFGFVSKYKKGAEVPTGSTEFQFRAGDLNFHSNTYEWLVISGHKAQFKGVGTINGEGNFGFLLTATDAALTESTDEDGFRIKIWDIDAGDVLVYDNKIGEEDTSEATTSLGGGSIVIHSGKGGK